MVVGPLSFLLVIICCVNSQTTYWPIDFEGDSCFNNGTTTDCDKCTSSTNCVWCTLSKASEEGPPACVEGSFIGMDSLNVCHGDWYYGQCTIPGNFMKTDYSYVVLVIIAFVVLVVLIILITLLLLYCCKMCKKDKDDDEVELKRKPTTVEKEEKEEKIIEIPPSTPPKTENVSNVGNETPKTLVQLSPLPTARSQSSISQNESAVESEIKAMKQRTKNINSMIQQMEKEFGPNQSGEETHSVSDSIQSYSSEMDEESSASREQSEKASEYKDSEI